MSELGLLGAADSWPVRDQGATDACVVYAVTAAHETVLQVFALSEQSLQWSVAAEVAGSRPPYAFFQVSDALKRRGQVPVDDWEQYGEHAPTAVWSRASMTEMTDVEDLLALLQSGRAAVIGIDISDEFLSLRGSPAVLDKPPKRRGTFVPKHAVTALSLSDGEHVLVRNSWGPGWGHNGYALLSTRYLAAALRRVFRLELVEGANGSELVVG